MKFIIFMFFILFLILNPNKNITYKSNTSKKISKTYKNFKFKIKYSTLNYTNKEYSKLKEAIKILKMIFNSKEYKEEVVNFSYKGKKQFKYNLWMSNEEIYNYIMLGAEEYNRRIDHTMNLYLEMYDKNDGIIGYTYFSSPVIYTNRWYHSKLSPCEIASNIAHEYTHQLGFDHDDKPSEENYYSVPYGHNIIIQSLCPLYYSNKLTML